MRGGGPTGEEGVKNPEKTMDRKKEGGGGPRKNRSRKQKGEEEKKPLSQKCRQKKKKKHLKRTSNLEGCTPKKKKFLAFKDPGTKERQGPR